MLLLVDNRDSFTFNLYQYLAEIGQDVVVKRAASLDLADVRALGPAAVVTGPGPGHPAEAHLSIALPRALPRRVPLLGVCLGHQALALAYGARIVQLDRPWHGHDATVQTRRSPLFQGLPRQFQIGQYHSLAVDPGSLPACLSVIGSTPDGTVQALRYRHKPQFGVQFHPESILSEGGHALLRNFVALIPPS
ncbi:MAG: aminodeoxychorismate/anthranilate synthase component II [Planctomycetota bacterium]